MTSNRLPLALALSLPLVFAACGGDGLTLPPEGEAANITVIEGDGQSGRVGSTLGKPLLVQVTDTRDRPVADANVVFSFPNAATGEASPNSSTTNSEGFASTTLRLGSVPGAVTGMAEVPVPAGITPVQAAFTATALSDDANGIAAVSGDGQSAPINSALPAPLVVQVTDRFGNPVSGLTIGWTLTGGGSVSQSSTVTDANGLASVTRTLGGTAGPQTTSAVADGLAGSPVVFSHTATAGSATGVVKVSGDGQSGSPGEQLNQPLVVQVLDAAGNPIPSQAVTWVIGTGGGSVAPENTTTDAEGHASTRWTLGPAVGENTVNAVVSGVGTATFSATATAGAPGAANSDVSASPATIAAGGGTSTITVLVRDDANNPVAGVSVSIESSGTGNNISPATATTGSNGAATFSFSSTVAETKTITAIAAGVTISDQATITVQKVASVVEITSDDPDPSVVGQAVRVEFTVTGSGGTPTGTVTVTVSGGLPTETCTEALSAGSGSCEVTMAQPGTGTNNRRVITATYSGDDRFLGDTDNDNHRVDPVVVPNTAPTAAFEANCSELTCTFTDQSSDPDNDMVGWTWDFGDGTSSTERNPSHAYASGGTFTVRLTVQDDDNATDDHTEQVTVTEPPPENTPPTATDDSYATATDIPLNEPAGSLTANDSEPEPGDIYSTSAASSTTTAGGDVSVSTDGSFGYTPPAGFTGSDTFQYTLSDGRGGSDTATVTITVGP